MNNKEFQKGLPKKRMGVGVLIFNGSGEILLVKPIYKDHWSFVGGVVDANESPRQACIREVKEEIDLDISPEFVSISYYPETDEKTESLQFLFNAGKISQDQIDKIKIDQKEIGEYRFFKIEEIEKVLTETGFNRLQKSLEAIKNNGTIYLE